VPTVGVQEPPFKRLVESATRANGTPHARRAYLSGLILNRSDAELRALVDGEDPYAGKPFMTQVVEQLTQPLAAPEAPSDRSRPRLLEPDTEDNLRALFEQNHWTDFLPIVLPTEERVAAMLAATSHAPDEVIGKLRPAAFREYWEFTVEHVAANAVMAGARPECFPVLLAIAGALALPVGAASSDNIARGALAGHSLAKESSITSFAGMTVVNGPIRHEIGMNCGIGALGPYNHANATIGRAFGLFAQNVQGGSVPGETYMGTLGNPLGYNNTCFAENEERSPWEPLHVRQGFQRDESVVTVGMAPCFGRTIDIGDLWEESLATKVREQIDGGPGGGAVLVLDPDAARRIGDKNGPKSAEAMKEWLAQHAGTTRADLLRDSFWWGMLRKPLAESGTEPFASWATAPDDELLQTAAARQFQVVVTGGETAPTVYFFSGSLHTSRSIDEWR
jgi:hypothetical protein